MIANPGDVITPAEAAEVLKVPLKTVVALCARGTIPGARKGVRHDWIVAGKKTDAEAFEARKRREIEVGNQMAIRLNDINAAMVEAYKAKRLSAGIRPSTVNDDIKVLFAVLSYARYLGMPVGTLKVRRLKIRGRRNAEAWSITEVKLLFDAVARMAPDLLPIVVFLLISIDG